MGSYRDGQEQGFLVDANARSGGENQGKQHELRDLFFEASLKVAREGELL